MRKSVFESGWYRLQNVDEVSRDNDQLLELLRRNAEAFHTYHCMRSRNGNGATFRECGIRLCQDNTSALPEESPLEESRT